MTLYLLVVAAIFAVSTAITFSTKVVSNQHVLAHIVLFPIVYLLCGMPPDGLMAQIFTGILIFVVGIVPFVIWKIGGGVVRAFAIAGLWIPGISLLFKFVILTLICGGIYSVLFMKSKKLVHYAAMIFAICCGMLIHQFSETKPAISESAAISNDTDKSALPLRGPSKLR